MAASLSQAGPSIQFGPAGHWVAALPEANKEEILRTEPDVLAKWDAEWGDRQTELVMIGMDMERSVIEDELDQCLLSDEEMLEDWGILKIRYLGLWRLCNKA